MTRLTTTADVIDTFGGTAEFAQCLAVEYKIAHDWRRKNRFPARYTDAIRELLEKEGLSAPAELFGQVRPDVAHDCRRSV
jgi:hypothetical protein